MYCTRQMTLLFFHQYVSVFHESFKARVIIGSAKSVTYMYMSAIQEPTTVCIIIIHYLHKMIYFLMCTGKKIGCFFSGRLSSFHTCDSAT